MKFLILSNPRSRTKWLSEYLNCGHDLVLGCRSVDEFVTRLNSVVGSVETGVALGWKLWRELFPSIPFVIVHRPPLEIVASFERRSLSPDLMFLYQQDLALVDCYENDFNVSMFDFERLDSVDARRLLCKFVKVPFDETWDAELAIHNIQVDLAERYTRVRDTQQDFIAFNNNLASRLLALEYPMK